MAETSSEPKSNEVQNAPPADGVSVEQQATPVTSAETAAAIQTGVQPITSNLAPVTGFGAFASFGPGMMHTVAEDVTETLPDGRVVQVAAKGTAIPMAQAHGLGLVDGDGKPAIKEAGPSEKKPAKGGSEKK